MGKFDGVSDEELIARLRAGETAIEDYLMEKYKGLVRQKARAMFLIGGDTDDLIQEGMIGLFKAVRDFQTDKEASFATFARVCIDRQIYSAIQNSNRQKHQPLNSYVSLNQEDESSPIWELSVENPESIIIDQETTSMENDMVLQHSEKRYFPVIITSANAVEEQSAMEPYFMYIILNTGVMVEQTVW